MNRSSSCLAYTLLISFALPSAVTASMDAASSDNHSSTPPTIEVLVLSRGNGVPEATREVFQRIVELANSAIAAGIVDSVKQEVIGLEGETRLCIQLYNEAGLLALDKQVSALAADTELLQLSNNSCPR